MLTRWCGPLTAGPGALLNGRRQSWQSRRQSWRASAALFALPTLQYASPSGRTRRGSPQPTRIPYWNLYWLGAANKDSVLESGQSIRIPYWNPYWLGATGASSLQLLSVDRTKLLSIERSCLLDASRRPLPFSVVRSLGRNMLEGPVA